MLLHPVCHPSPYCNSSQSHTKPSEEKMVVTHADLAPTPNGSVLHSKLGAFLMVLSILLGLSCFILCLIAESSRSQVKWNSARTECTYTGSGMQPLLSATAAFSALAVAAVVQHVYLLVAVSKSDSIAEISWSSGSVEARRLSWQAGFFFVSTWTSFALGEILLLIGLSVESGHLHNWKTPRSNGCLVVGPGLLTTAGVFGLLTVFLASGLYITALRIEMHFQEQENMTRQMLEASAMYASPIRSFRVVHGEDPLPRQDQNVHTLEHYLRDFDKNSSVV